MLISTGTSKQVLIYTWAEKRGAVFARLHCVGERSRVPLGIDCQPCTERGMRSIAARPTGTIGVSGRAGWPTCKPIWIGPPCGGTARSGAPKPKEVESDLDRSRGGFRTKIHILADRRSRFLRLRVAGGQRHEPARSRHACWGTGHRLAPTQAARGCPL